MRGGPSATAAQMPVLATLLSLLAHSSLDAAHSLHSFLPRPLSPQGGPFRRPQARHVRRGAVFRLLACVHARIHACVCLQSLPFVVSAVREGAWTEPVVSSALPTFAPFLTVVACVDLCQ